MRFVVRATIATGTDEMTDRNGPGSEHAIDRWIYGFRRHCVAEGIRPDVFDSAFRDVGLNEEIVRRDRSQPEFVTPIRDYIATVVSVERIRNGLAALRLHSDLLGRIEGRFGVEKEVIVAIWGVESFYGRFRGEIPVIEALFTLAHDGRRREFFEWQLLAALRILQAGDTDPGNMIGSWAGAMGHTQFMPDIYSDHAQDFDGDGRRDIWGDDPADALASTASYLAYHGWITGQPWGMEVTLPGSIDYSSMSRKAGKSTREWRRLGVKSANALPLPDCDEALILLPAGHRGAAFVAFDNFHVLRRYNAADFYVIGVGHLADRLRGEAPIRGSWPNGDRALSASETKDLQRLLLERGFDPNGLDGIAGPDTVAAVQAYQSSIGLVPDGYASFEVLEHLR